MGWKEDDAASGRRSMPEAAKAKRMVAQGFHKRGGKWVKRTRHGDEHAPEAVERLAGQAFEDDQGNPLTPGQAKAALAAGKLRVDPAAVYSMTRRNADGELESYDVDGSSMGTALAQGLQLEDADETHREKAKADASTLTGQIRTFAEGVAGSASMGLSDLEAARGPGTGKFALANALGGALGYDTQYDVSQTEGDKRRTIEKQARAEENAGTHLAGSLVGAMAPVGPAGAVSGVAKLGGQAVRGAGSSVLRRMAGLAAEGAIGGAGFGAAGELSRVAEANEELTAEKLLAGAGEGAWLGAATGLGFGALGEVGKAGLSRLRAPSASGGLGVSRLSGAAEQKALKGAGFIGKDLSKLDDAAQSRLGRRLLDEGLAGKVGGTVDDAAARIQVATKEAGEHLGTFRTKLDDMLEKASKTDGYRGATRGPDLKAAAKRFRDLAKKEPNAIEGVNQAGQIKKLEKWAKALEKADAQGALGFKEAQSLRKSLDDHIYTGGRQAKNRDLAVKARAALEEEVETAVERVAGDLPDFNRDAYKAAKQRYSDLASVDRVSSKRVGMIAGNNSLGPMDSLAGAAGASIGATVGGGLVGGMVGGAAVGGASKFIRSRYDNTAAAALNWLSRGNKRLDKGVKALAASKKAAKAEQNIAQGFRDLGYDAKQTSAAVRALKKSRAAERAAKVERATGAAGSGAIKGTATLDQEKLLEKAESARAVTGNPSLAIERATQKTEGLPHGVGSVIVNKAMTGAAFLASKAPAVARMDSMNPGAEKTLVSQSELRKFQRYVEGVEDPMSVLDDVKAGRLSVEKVEAVEAVYPALFGEMQRLIIEQAGQSASMPYQTRLQLGILFKAPLHETMRPESVGRSQAGYAAEDPSGEGRPGGGPARVQRGAKIKINVSKSHATGDSLEEKF